VTVAGSDPASSAEKAGVPLSASNLALRVLSAAILAPLALLVAYVGGWPFALFWGIAAIIVLWEWLTLVVGPSYRFMLSSCAAAIAVADLLACFGKPVTALWMIGLGALAAAIFAPREWRLWVLGGTGYAGGMMLAPIFLRADDGYGFVAILFLFAIVWTTDIFGYFGGRVFGGPKLWPAISPKKTWSGAVAGTIGATIVALLVVAPFGSFDRIAITATALILSIVSQAGDLFESWVKRQFDAKDSSRLIPGHGGAMDRLDGFWAAATVACVIGLLRAGVDEPAHGLLIW
jgi:phosphatidate cytidylyltransferase